ncbi:MAG TPA: hypothetical protein PKN96_00775 [Flavobacterium sp.]|uniref:hypothetical protein n=1 Tax=Flavobacterium sp. TaxID=239 RepID=UPI002C992D3F|nr:hypothetical protein [Flavobacterium sp.]HNP31804.1 hypothetical protein [Flavobacterium sp.]
MKKIILFFMLGVVLNSCALNLEQEKYNFDNFKETPLWELAQAVRADDADKIKEILKNKKLNVDLKEHRFNQTLLNLAIINKKRNAFLELLNADANPNELIGIPVDSTPFVESINNMQNCDLYFVENMLKHGANPNLEIKNPTPEYIFANSFPLLAAIGNHNENGSDCLSLYELLINSGADINCCYKQPESSLCEGVLAKALTLNKMETLRYFVIEKKINIPDTVIIFGEGDKTTQKAYGLREVLNSEDYKFEDFERDGHKYDRSEERKFKEEILNYLDKIGK